MTGPEHLDPEVRTRARMDFTCWSYEDAVPEALQKVREFAHGVLERRERAMTSVRPDQAAEATLLARWFRLRPAEPTSTWHADAPRILEGARLLDAM
jgi:hypothetical protein